MGKALWSGRFEGEMDKETLEFTSSLDVDSELAFYDIMGSIAHVQMLKKCGIIEKKDADTIVKGLRLIFKEFEEGTFEVDMASEEDIHSVIESRLTQIVGPVGGKLHTGRSRNDQVAADTRMYLREAVIDSLIGIDLLIQTLTDIAKNSKNVILPGLTHTQHAQPVTLSHHMLAHAFRLNRDAERLFDAFKRINVCPLGAAALAGTTYPIDRNMTATALGFKKPTENSMDSVSDRDFVVEAEFCASLLAVHLSSVAEELILWSSPEFGFIELSDNYSTGSSIMPQKKNPDIAELIRGKTGSVIGNLVSMLITLKGLPLTYNRDLQEDKERLMDSFDIVIPSVTMVSNMISTMRINEDRMLAMASEGFMNATDLADYLVTKGMPFRDAHATVAAIVRYCISEKRDLEKLKLSELKGFADIIDDDVFDILPIVKCVERRNSYGGTSESSVNTQIDMIAAVLSEREEKLRSEMAKIEKCWDTLIGIK